MRVRERLDIGQTSLMPHLNNKKQMAPGVPKLAGAINTDVTLGENVMSLTFGENYSGANRRNFVVNCCHFWRARFLPDQKFSRCGLRICVRK